ncbi:hypothetical protein WA158_000718 [Blastocystis sp. Blastoise]
MNSQKISDKYELVLKELRVILEKNESILESPLWVDLSDHEKDDILLLLNSKSDIIEKELGINNIYMPEWFNEFVKNNMEYYHFNHDSLPEISVLISKYLIQIHQIMAKESQVENENNSSINYSNIKNIPLPAEIHYKNETEDKSLPIVTGDRECGYNSNSNNNEDEDDDNNNNNNNNNNEDKDDNNNNEDDDDNNNNEDEDDDSIIESVIFTNNDTITDETNITNEKNDMKSTLKPELLSIIHDRLSQCQLFADSSSLTDYIHLSKYSIYI